MTSVVPLIFSSSWASGVNAWITLLVLGLFARFSDTSVIPHGFGNTLVLAAAGTMVLIELVLDKIPLIDSTWDAISTAVRPTVAAVIAYQLAGQSGHVDQALMAALGGGTALASHSVKSGLRLAVNASPEPASNAVVSTLEDLSVAGVTVLAVQHPWWALGIASTLLLIGIIAVVLLIAAIRAALQRFASRTQTT